VTAICTRARRSTNAARPRGPPPHTPRHAVIEAAATAREVGADLIVTVGGGSITDGAKAVQLCLGNNVRNAEAIDGLRPVKGPDGALGPPPNMKPPSVRQVTVPTTLSAGEFSAYSGITDERHRIKELFRHPLIIPRAVVLDPAVTVHTPEWLFLSTGVRAVDHCVEGICSGEVNPYADAQALHGLSLLLVQTFLRRATLFLKLPLARTIKLITLTAATVPPGIAAAQPRGAASMPKG
jgi:maleylacetate reductase